MNVGQDLIERGLHDAYGAGGENRPLIVQSRHQDLHPPALRSEQILGRHLTVGENKFARLRAPHAELVELFPDAEALEGAFDDERGDAPALRRRIRLGIDDDHLGDGTVGDPELRAVEDIAVAPLFSPQAHRNHVRPGLRLGHGESAHMLAANEAGKIFPFLAARAVAANLVHAQVGMGAVGKANRTGSAGDLLHGNAMFHVAEPRSAIFLLHGDAEHAESAQFRPEMARKRIAAVDFIRKGSDFISCKTLHCLANGLRRLTETEIKAAIISSAHMDLLSWALCRE